MEMVVFAVFDEKVGSFAKPFFLQNDNVARRGFGDAVLDEKTELARHSSDYKLYRLAVYDDKLGSFVNEKQPVFLAAASDYKNNLVKE